MEDGDTELRAEVEKMNMQATAEREKSESEDESLFPDTAIQLQHVKGDK